MATYTVHSTAQLQEDEIERLERRLAIAASKIRPSHKRGSDEPATYKDIDDPDLPDLDMLTREIVEAAQNGINIASQIESFPLIPLMEALKKPLPAELKVAHEQSKYVFYVAQVIFSILLPTDQYTKSATLGITLKDDIVDSARKTRPIRLFPARKDINLFTVNLGGGIGIDTEINLAVPQMASQIIPFAKASVDANIKSGFVFGPIEFPFRQAQIEVYGEADQNIGWRYNLDTALFGTNDFKSFLILKVAQEARSLQMYVELKITPCKRRWLVFENVLPELLDQKLLPVELLIPES